MFIIYMWRLDVIVASYYQFAYLVNNVLTRVMVVCVHTNTRGWAFCALSFAGDHFEFLCFVRSMC